MLQYRIFFKSLHIFAILARNWQIARPNGPIPARLAEAPPPPLKMKKEGHDSPATPPKRQPPVLIDLPKGLVGRDPSPHSGEALVKRGSGRGDVDTKERRACRLGHR